MRALARDWRGPVEFLVALGDLDIKVLVIWDDETYQRRLKVVADPWHEIDDIIGWYLVSWEDQLIACIDERRMRPDPPEGCPYCPDAVVFAPAPSGRQGMGYFDGAGEAHTFELDRDGLWRPIPDGRCNS